MRLFSAFRQATRWSRTPDTKDTRHAFQAGARHALSELIDHLDVTDEAAAAAYRLNDEIHAFAKVALLDQ